MKFILSQIIGAVAFSLFSYSFFKKSKKEILYIQILAYIGFIVHFYLMDAPTGTMCNIIGLISVILLYFFADNKEKKRFLIFTLIALLILLSFITYENIFSIFPITASVITFLSFLSKNKNLIRLIGVISASLWLIYAIIIVSYSAIVFETITVIATIVAYLKNIKKH